MILTVEGMTCGHCKAAVEQAIAQAGGRAEIDLQSGKVTVENLTAEQATEVIRAAGYEVRPD
ncbi:MAG: cation transporter [Paracoccus sp. (in: a-proteobacteria)]|nr:cation transporter [Paracoccus sp. (in: a-proteobacteria)]